VEVDGGQELDGVQEVGRGQEEGGGGGGGGRWRAGAHPQLMDLVFVQSLHRISLLVGMAVKGHMKSYLRMQKHAKLVWPKVEWRRQVKGERLFMSFQRTLYKSIKGWPKGRDSRSGRLVEGEG